MSYNRDGLRHPTHIFEAALWRYVVKVACSRCSHVATFEPAGLWWHFQRRGWDDWLPGANKRFWCTQCASKDRRKVRPKKLEFAEGVEPTRQLPLPSDAEWKRALSRYRS
jgi:hypothetical protein